MPPREMFNGLGFEDDNLLGFSRNHSGKKKCEDSR